MKLININDYDICNYKKPAMFLIFPYCSFKCDKECGLNICQNSALAHEPIIEIRVADIIHRYLDNPLTHAVVCGGLEPFDNKDSLYTFLKTFRSYSNDPIIIYTGYTEKELENELAKLKTVGNLIIKYGRYVPNVHERYDEILGVTLASDNQYAKYYE